jgi:hypothetical protein
VPLLFVQPPGTEKSSAAALFSIRLAGDWLYGISGWHRRKSRAFARLRDAAVAGNKSREPRYYSISLGLQSISLAGEDLGIGGQSTPKSRWQIDRSFTGRSAGTRQSARIAQARNGTQ